MYTCYGGGQYWNLQPELPNNPNIKGNIGLIMDIVTGVTNIELWLNTLIQGLDECQKSLTAKEGFIFIDKDMWPAQG
jgi:hypothetical protein